MEKDVSNKGMKKILKQPQPTKKNMLGKLLILKQLLKTCNLISTNEMHTSIIFLQSTWIR